MKNNFAANLLLPIFCLLTYSLHTQTFTDIPGPMGTTRCLLKGLNGELYIGSSTKGVFRSLDNGQTWSGLGGNTIMTGRINALAFDTSGQIMAATEQGGIKRWNGTAWISINAGLQTGCGIPIPIRALAVDPAGNYYAGAHGYTSCFTKGDLYHFDGTSWVSIAAGLTNTNINSLAIHPLNGALYAGTEAGVFRYDGIGWTAFNAGLSDTIVHKIVFNAAGDLWAATDGGISVLSANASNWTSLNNGLNGIPVHAIAIDQDPAHLIISSGYSIEQTGSLYGQLFETFDAGNHWSPIAPNIESTFINHVAFTGNNHCFALGWGIFRTTDNGQSWAAANNGFSAKTFNTQGRVAVSATPNRALFYGSDDGLFRSVDNGLTWTMASRGLTRHMITLLKTDHYGNIFCGVMRYLGENSVGFGDGYLFKSSDNGDHWQPVVISKDWRYLEISELPDGDLICAHGFGAQPPSATIIGSSLARSTDHGDTWIDLDVHSNLAYCCAANAAGDMFVAGESQSVFRSTDGGNSFDLIVAPGQSGNVGVLEVSPTGDIFMSSGGTRTLFFSTDNGSTYETFNSPVLPDYRGVSDVTFDHLGMAYCSSTGQGGTPALFTVSPPFTANSTFTPVAGLAGSLFKMTWDECGYLYIYRAGGILKSSVPLRLPEVSCSVSSTSTQWTQNDIEVSPNPATDELYIRATDNSLMRVEIWNMSGQLMMESMLSGETTLHITDLCTGMYTLKFIQADQAVLCRKLLKK